MENTDFLTMAFEQDPEFVAMVEAGQPIPVVISPSQQLDNQCADGDKEANHCRLIGQVFYNNLLQDKRLIPLLIPPISGDANTYLSKIVELSDAWINKYGGKGFHIAIHTDAFNGKAYGCSVFFYAAGGPGEKLARALYSEISNLTPWSDRSCTAYPELYELRKTQASAALAELSFHDNKEQADFIHAHINDFAAALTSGLYKGIGIDPYTPVQKPIEQVLAEGAKTAGLITDVDYWTSVLKGDEPCNPEWLKVIFSRATKIPL